MLACMDTRLDLFPMLGLERGDAHIIRNAGGLATDDAIRSLSASQRLLGTEEIVVVMHEGCGLHGASEDEFAQALAADGVLPTWRLGAFDDVEAALRQSLARLRTSRELSGSGEHPRLCVRSRDRPAPRAALPRRVGFAAMRAVTFQAPGRVSVEDRPEPSLVNPDDAVVRVEATGVCGSTSTSTTGA